MNDTELKNLWQSSNEKIEMNLHLNQKNSNDITRLKVYHYLSSMKPTKLFALAVGLIWVGVGLVVLSNLYIHGYNEVPKFLLYSATIQIGITAIAIWIYLYQLITIYRIDNTQPILQTQQQLTSLKTSTLWVTRILFLQLPVWTTFYWNQSMLENENWVLWIIQGIITASFLYLSIWLFINIKFENRHKKWFLLMFSGKEWTPLMNSMELLEEIEDYKK